MNDLHALRPVPYMGVIYVVAEAVKLGYSAENPDWCNLGQGMPEVGPLPGAPDRISNIAVEVNDHAYGPVNGLPELRRTIADLYRRWHGAQYGPENVCVTAGGRLALSRAVAALGPVNIGYFLPDYTAYEDMLGAFPQFTPVAIPLDNDFGITIDRLEDEITRRGLRALIISNPCNPTGRVIPNLREWVALARRYDCTMLFDEFYSHYVWKGKAPVSAAAFAKKDDPILVFDGLTKSYRYPGWRVGWVAGPARMIEQITCAGSFLDGGGSRPIQRAAIRVLQNADQETEAMRRAFRPKRDLMLKRLKKMGVKIPRAPEGTFYVWGDVGGDGFEYFRRALKKKVITVPGEFFDVNPRKHRTAPSRFKNFVRFSYGAPMATVEKGLDRLAK